VQVPNPYSARFLDQTFIDDKKSGVVLIDITPSIQDGDNVTIVAEIQYKDEDWKEYTAMHPSFPIGSYNSSLYFKDAEGNYTPERDMLVLNSLTGERIDVGFSTSYSVPQYKIRVKSLIVNGNKYAKINT